jgi:hypothetical protein
MAFAENTPIAASQGPLMALEKSSHSCGGLTQDYPDPLQGCDDNMTCTHYVTHCLKYIFQETWFF